MASTSVDASFSIDTTELRKKIYYRFGSESVGVFVDELNTGMDQCGRAARKQANALIKGGEGSRLAKSAKITRFVSRASQGVIVDWNSARSDAGFPYAAAVNTGRKAFGPVNKKVLRFEIDGRVIFAKHVRAFAGVHFTTRGLVAARPSFDGYMHAVIFRWRLRTGNAL